MLIFEYKVEQVKYRTELSALGGLGFLSQYFEISTTKRQLFPRKNSRNSMSHRFRQSGKRRGCGRFRVATRTCEVG